MVEFKVGLTEDSGLSLRRFSCLLHLLGKGLLAQGLGPNGTLSYKLYMLYTFSSKATLLWWMLPGSIKPHKSCTHEL